MAENPEAQEHEAGEEVLAEKVTKRSIKGILGDDMNIWTHVTKTVQAGETSRIEEVYELRVCASCGRIYSDQCEPMRCAEGEYACSACASTCADCGQTVCSQHASTDGERITCSRHIVKRILEWLWRVIK